MRDRLAAGLLVLFLGCAQTTDNAMNTQILTVSVSCRDNPDCLFTDQDMFVDIRMTNEQDADVRIPIEYLRKSGPFVKLIDARTKAVTSLKGNLADPALRAVLTSIPPHGSVIIEWVITADELRHFGPRVDLTAEFTVKSAILIGGKEIDFSGTGGRRIVSKQSGAA